jgi:hypothetical protein
MPRRSWVLLAAFVAWTAFIWITRINNAWTSSTESTGGKVVSTVLAGALLALAAGGLIVLVRTWGQPLSAGAARFLQVFAGVTVAVWVVRVAQILVTDNTVAFKVVHAFLGVISVALAVAVWRTAAPIASRSTPAPGTAGDRSLAGSVDGGGR